MEFVLTYVLTNITLVVKIKITSQFNRMSAVQSLGSWKFDNEVVPVCSSKWYPVSKDEELQLK
jgi:hypothetical protein